MTILLIDVYIDVMTTKVDDDRLEKERAAVLSEASMVNKMEYRYVCRYSYFILYICIFTPILIAYVTSGFNKF